MSKLKFTQTDHKHWESNLLGAEEMPVFTIDTTYRNKYLAKRDRAKSPYYNLKVWVEGTCAASRLFGSLKDAINHAKIIKP